MYIHIRKSDGLVFYVGQGQRCRAWSKSGRNDHWQKVSSRHGFNVEFVDVGLTKNGADLLEKLLISQLRMTSDKMTNKTDGGEGVSGLKFTEDQRANLSRAHGASKTCCSNGMKFGSTQLAAEWLNKNGWPRARQGHISACCRNERTAAYGHCWWYEGGEPKKYEPRYERMSKTRSTEVICSNGMTFRNQNFAAAWLRDNGFPKATQSGVGQCIRGVIKKYHGFGWRNNE